MGELKLNDIIPINFDNIPQYMREQPRWTVWFIPDWKPGTEKPYKSIRLPTGESCPEGYAITKNTGTFDIVKAACNKNSRYYPAFWIEAENKDGLIFLDYDGSSNNIPTIPQIPSYCEHSVYGYGYHILGWYKGNKPVIPETDVAYTKEVYLGGRWIVMTGSIVDNRTKLNDLTEYLKKYVTTDTNNLKIGEPFIVPITATERHPILKNMVASMVAKKYSFKTILAAIQEENLATFKPPKTTAQIEKEVISMYDWATKKQIAKEQKKLTKGQKNEIKEPRLVALPPYIYDKTDDETGKTTTHIDFFAYSNFLKDHFSIVYFNKTIYIYDHTEHFYRPQSNEIETHVRNILLEYNIKTKLPGALIEVKSHITSMGCYSEYPFNNASNTIPVENGIVKINYDNGSIELLPHHSSHLFTYKLSITYNPEIRNCDAIFLLKRMVDPEHIKTLIQIPAQALLQMQTGNAYKKAYLLQGETHAGKTSYLKLLYATFGDNFTCHISLQQLCEDRFVGGNLESKLLNIYDDLEDVALAVIDQFKTLTGDCRHGIERKYEAKYTGKVTAVHIFTCNYPPEYPGKVKRDAAFWARWEYLKFPFTYPVNPNFYVEWYTQTRLSSFFNLILAAMIHIKKYGLLSNSDVQEVMQNWSVNSDPIYDFIAHIFEPYTGTIPNHYSKTKLHLKYLEWCTENEIPEHKRKLTMNAFTTALQIHHFVPSQKKEKKKVYETYATTAYTTQYNSPLDLDYKPSVVS